MILNLPIVKRNMDCSIFHIGKRYIYLESEEDIKAVSLKDFSIANFRYVKKGKVRKSFECDGYFYFRDNASVVKPGDLFRVSNDDLSIEKLGRSPFKMINFIGDNENQDLFFSFNSKEVKTVRRRNLSILDFKDYIKYPFPKSGALVVGDKLVLVERGQRVQAYELSGALHWEQTLFDYGLDSHTYDFNDKSEIKPCTCSYKEDVLINVFPYRLVSINAQSGDLNWVLPDVVDKEWIIGNEGKVYSVFKGNLKVVDAETGELLLDKPINSDWVQAEKDTLNLFQVNVSSTHLWCGFLGHGLCAVNLETAEIDWHEFDSQSLNRKPIIKNNRVYVQLMSGGIGLDNEGTQEYILEGEGGYIEDSDNEFVVF
jgi:hypothetical protein